jgi:hypothetical protein
MTGWDPSDLVRRVLRSLEFASRAVDGIPGMIGEKVVAETAMLLHCAAAVQHVDRRIRDAVADIAVGLIPRARGEAVLAAICLDPGLALDHAFAHILLSGLGYPDAAVDDLLAASIALGPGFGPERLPHRCLEQEWLMRVWTAGGPRRCPETPHLAHSLLGRPLDALGASRIDLYAFTHAVMYASDLGSRRLQLPRSTDDVEADAVAGLAYSLGAADPDLTAELLLTWPMLGLEWNTAAAFGFQWLADVDDTLGFLPGSSFDPARYHALAGDEQPRYALVTCYHTVFVMGFLCSAALGSGGAPPARVPPGHRTTGAATALLMLSATDTPAPRWREMVEAMSPGQQDALAPLLLAMLLRQAKTQCDLGRVRDALHVALEYGLTDGTAPAQAAKLLLRGQALDRHLAARRPAQGHG